MTMNSVCLIGKLVADIHCKQSKSGKVFATFALGVPRDYKEKGEKYAVQDMIACRVWGQHAERMERYTSKGDWVAVRGKIMVDRYEYNGERKSFMCVVCDNIDLVRSRGANWASGVPSRETMAANKDTGNTYDEVKPGGESVSVGDMDWW